MLWQLPRRRSFVYGVLRAVDVHRRRFPDRVSAAQGGEGEVVQISSLTRRDARAGLASASYLYSPCHRRERLYSAVSSHTPQGGRARGLGVHNPAGPGAARRLAIKSHPDLYPRHLTPAGPLDSATHVRRRRGAGKCRQRKHTAYEYYPRRWYRYCRARTFPSNHMPTMPRASSSGWAGSTTASAASSSSSSS